MSIRHAILSHKARIFGDAIKKMSKSLPEMESINDECIMS